MMKRGNNGKRFAWVVTLAAALLIPITVIAANDSYDYTYSGTSTGGLDTTYILKVKDASTTFYCYCLDRNVHVSSGVPFTRENIEDVFPSYADKIRAIVLKGYPHTPFETLKINVTNYYSNLDPSVSVDLSGLSKEEAVCASQYALWHYTNSGTSFPQLSNADINNVYEYLTHLDGVSAGSTPVAGIHIEKTVTVSSDGTCKLVIEYYADEENADGSDVNLSYQLLSGVPGSATVTDGTANSHETVIIDGLSVPYNISIKISGNQDLAQNVYLYNPLGGQSASQTLVGIAEGGTNISKTFTACNDAVSVSVDKEWVNIAAAGAPAVTVTLTADGDDTAYQVTLDGVVDAMETTPWQYTFANLPEKDGDGDTIDYGVVEEELVGYDTEITGNAGSGYTITNTKQLVDVSVDKKWVGLEYSGSITFELYRHIAGGGSNLVDSVDRSASTGWDYTFEDLDKYDNAGHLYTYTVEENAITNYLTDIEDNGENSFTITNYYNVTDISVTKEWKKVKAKNAPEVTIYLIVDGDTEDPLQTITLDGSEDPEWAHTFSDLPKYDSDFDLINYGIWEEPMIGYDTEITGNTTDGFIVTNTKQKIKVKVCKTWQVNEDTVLPASITYNLYRNIDGEEPAFLKSAECTEATGWDYIFKNLDKYDDDGHLYTYTLDETAIPYYITDISGNMTDGFDVINILDETYVTVNKVWSGLEEGDTPPAVTFTLQINGVDDPTHTVTLDGVVDDTETIAWSYTFGPLHIYSEYPTKIDYSVVEETLIGFDTEMSGDAETGFTFTNTKKKIDVEVEKVWQSDDGVSYPGIEVQLYRNIEGGAAEKVGEKQPLNMSNNWHHTYEDLYEYDNDGNKYFYYVSEVTALEDYQTEIGRTEETGKLTLTITNTRTGITSIPVEKVWVDLEDAEHDPITIYLVRGDERVDSLVLSNGNDWSSSFDNLEQFDDQGKTIQYTVEEDELDGYDTAIERVVDEGEVSFIVTNTLQDEDRDITVRKVWRNDRISVRPDDVTFILYADGEEIDRVTFDGFGREWNYTFTDLPTYVETEDGMAEIEYTIDETRVGSDYTKRVSGFTIYNTYHDDDDEDGDEEGEEEEPPIDIPPVTPPLDDQPETPDNPGGDLIDIFDNDVPLDASPSTGDQRNLTLLLLLAGLAALFLTASVVVVRNHKK